MKVVLEIDLKSKKLSEIIFKSLEPDMKKEKLTLKNCKIIFELEDENFSHILASCNSFLKLINEVIKLEKFLEEKTQRK